MAPNIALIPPQMGSKMIRSNALHGVLRWGYLVRKCAEQADFWGYHIWDPALSCQRCYQDNNRIMAMQSNIRIRCESLQQKHRFWQLHWTLT